MQENNNFETIISTWRRLSGEQTEPAGVSMSGDSPDFKPPKKKEEETDLLMPERSKVPVATIAAPSSAVTSSEIPVNNADKPEEKQEFIKREIEETKEAAGDTYDKDLKINKSDDFDSDKVTIKSDKQDSEKYGDKVDSVYLRPPPSHKTRSNASTVEEEDCVIKCLYYTLQCCDCVLM